MIYRNILILVKEEEKISGDINDYKFFCFDEKVPFFKIDFDRMVNHRANYYDRNFEILKFGEAAFPPDYNRKFNRPVNFDKMLHLASKLSKGFSFIRVDFYNLNGKIYFGELTFFPNSGNGPFTEPEADNKIGALLNLNLDCNK